MKQQICITLFFIVFITVFGYFYGGEYKSFYDQKTELSQEQKVVETELENFSGTDIDSLENIVFHATPNKELLDTLVQKVDAAQTRVYLEVYIFTEKRIFEALKKAHKRGVDVRVILEKNPYKAPRLNDSRYKDLAQSGIQVHWSNPRNYSLNHAKFLIIDDEVILSTGNMSYSTFTKNRDFFIFLTDADLLHVFERIFTGDFLGEVVVPYHKNLVLSPDYSREKIKQLFLSAQSSIDMYFQYLSDDALLDVLLIKAKEGVKVQIVIDDDYFDGNPEEVQFLISQGLDIRKYSSSSMHAKAVLIDKKTLFIGSVNFSTYSLDANREVGILIDNTDIIAEFLEVFEGDF